MSVNARVAGTPPAPRSRGNARRRPAVALGRSWFIGALLVELSAGEVVMRERLAVWAILAGGIALTAAAFFASADVTHWVMGLHRTDVVVRPGPTVYVTVPAHDGHARHRAPPAPAPAVPAAGGDFTSQQDARARPDHRDAHAWRHHRGDHARRRHLGDHAWWHRLGDHAWWHHQGAQAWPDHGGGCHKGQEQAQRIFAATGPVVTLAVTDIVDWLACSQPGGPDH